MDRVTYVTDKAYAIRSTISPSTTQRHRGQRWRTRPESPPSVGAGRRNQRAGGEHHMHHATSTHQARRLVFTFRVDASTSPGTHPLHGQLFGKPAMARSPTEQLWTMVCISSLQRGGGSDHARSLEPQGGRHSRKEGGGHGMGWVEPWAGE